MSDFSLVLQMAALGTGFCFLMTTLGAASVLFTEKESSPAFQRISLGFAAGIMVAASVWSLLIPSLEASSKDAIPWLPATGGFVLGIAFLLLMDKIIPHWHPAEDSPEGPKSNHSRTELLVAAVTLHNIPEGFEVPEGRVKPWGTAHAVLSCIDEVDGPFAVINADDYYGRDAFQKIYDFLSTHEDDDKFRYTMVGYQLENTLTENGHVARGVCTTNEAGELVKVEERTRIEKKVTVLPIQKMREQPGQIFRREALCL